MRVRESLEVTKNERAGRLEDVRDDIAPEPRALLTRHDSAASSIDVNDHGSTSTSAGDELPPPQTSSSPLRKRKRSNGSASLEAPPKSKTFKLDSKLPDEKQNHALTPASSSYEGGNHPSSDIPPPKSKTLKLDPELPDEKQNHALTPASSSSEGRSHPSSDIPQSRQVQTSSVPVPDSAQSEYDGDEALQRELDDALDEFVFSVAGGASGDDDGEDGTEEGDDAADSEGGEAANPPPVAAGQPVTQVPGPPGGSPANTSGGPSSSTPPEEIWQEAEQALQDREAERSGAVGLFNTSRPAEKLSFYKFEKKETTVGGHDHHFSLRRPAPQQFASPYKNWAARPNPAEAEASHHTFRLRNTGTDSNNPLGVSNRVIVHCPDAVPVREIRLCLKQPLSEKRSSTGPPPWRHLYRVNTVENLATALASVAALRKGNQTHGTTHHFPLKSEYANSLRETSDAHLSCD
ncbi:hypothetical protein MD484_g1518, partial [Candolleomyces efflorescens]